MGLDRRCKGGSGFINDISGFPGLKKACCFDVRLCMCQVRRRHPI